MKSETATDIDDLLLKTSRTFGISIPRLPHPLRDEITLAYLLFRIADTFEDATRWPMQTKINALDDFARALQGASAERIRGLSARWVEAPPCDHEGYIELLAQTPSVVEQALGLPDPSCRRIIAHTLRTIDGMKVYVARTTPAGQLRLEDIEDLRRYCYVVAGIVGEMLTDLFLLHCASLGKVEGVLREKAKLFGEGLQLVNILKDCAGDADEGRFYIPETVGRGRVFALARHSLEEAADYLLTARESGAAPGMLAFLALPLFLAWGTLDRVEAAGPGAKLTRPEVLRFIACVDQAFEAPDANVTIEFLHELCRSVVQADHDGVRSSRA